MMNTAGEFFNDLLALIDKHKDALSIDVKIQLMEFAIKNYHEQRQEIREAMRKHKIFYHNTNNN